MGFKINRLVILVVALATSAFELTAHAYYPTPSDRCTSVDLRDANLNMPVRDQGDISWCYAHASADYLQLYFKIAQPVSAADLALIFNHRPWPRFLRWARRDPVGETGFVRSAIWDALENGYCPEEYFPSNRWTKRYLSGAKKGQTEQLKINAAIEELIDLQSQIQMELFVSPGELPYTFDFKDVSSMQLYELLRDSTPLSFLENLRVAACGQHRIDLPAEIGAIAMRPKGPNTFNRINALLDAGAPIDIDFYSDFLTHPDSYRRRLANLHSTLVIGRKFDPQEGECRYLIRNSHGTQCDLYDPSHQCENGNIWVTESSLYQALVTYVYIKDPLFDDSGPDLRIESQDPESSTDKIGSASGDPDDQSASDDLDATDE